MLKFISIILLLAGCASTTKVQTVDIPIAVLCKTEEPAVPNYTFDKIKRENDLFDKVKSLLADRELSSGYQTELLTALRSCK